MESDKGNGRGAAYYGGLPASYLYRQLPLDPAALDMQGECDLNRKKYRAVYWRFRGSC